MGHPAPARAQEPSLLGTTSLTTTGHRGPVAKAFEYYAKAIDLDPKESVYYHNLAVTVYLFRKDAGEYFKLTEPEVFDKSLELYRQAIKLAPDDFVLFSDYAESFYGTNPPRWRDGLEAWTEALKIAHDEDEREGVYIHLARINLKLGNYDQARMRLNGVTNQEYATLRNRITANLNLGYRRRNNQRPRQVFRRQINSTERPVPRPRIFIFRLPQRGNCSFLAL